MKIVLIDREEGQKVGGTGVYTTRFYNYLKNKGHDVFILRFTKKKSRDPNIIRIPFYFAEERGILVIPTEKTLQILKDNLTRINPNIAYLAIGVVPLFDFLIPSACHDLKIPIAGVWHADFNNTHGSYRILTKSVFLAYLPLCKQLDLLHVFSAKLADFYTDKGIQKRRILVLPNGVDEKFYTPGTSGAFKKHKFKNGVLFVGRLTHQKNPEVLIKSFLSVDPPPTTKLVMVGYGDKKQQLQETYRDKRIIFTGAIIDEKRKLDIIRACQIFVLPSRFEGMPLAILEAMSCGLACITSDAGSNKELLENAGIVLPSTKLNQELPVTLRITLENPDFVKILGEKARNKVLENYSQQMIFEKLTQAFKKTIADYKKLGFPKSKPLSIDSEIAKKLRLILQKARKISDYLEI